MSRKNKNLRAFLHQNQEPTIEQAWDAAWHGAQKTFHARSMQEMREQADRLREALEDALETLEVVDPRHPTRERIDALLTELDNLEN